MSLSVGAAAPSFTLPDTDGVATSLNAEDSAATVVIFTCNHCPYALAWHGRLQDVERDYQERGVRFLHINSNDPAFYAKDSAEAMSDRVKAGEFLGPYLVDSSQQVGREWSATVTPEVFVIGRSGAVMYHGAPDGDFNDESLAAQWLRDALDDVLAGTPVRMPETEVRGCTVKYSNG